MCSSLCFMFSVIRRKSNPSLRFYILDSQIPSYPNLSVFWRNHWKGKKKMGLFFSRTIVNYIVSSSPMSKKTCGKFSPMQIESMVSLVSRTGRHLQRYDKDSRQVVGCIPYRYRNSKQCSSGEELEVLVISSQKGQAMMFPKGGWEIDESMEEAASRETLEEAGVVGKIEHILGTWRYKSKSQGNVHVGSMFPLLVKEQYDQWPEKNVRKRRWITVAEAKQVCKHGWMVAALDVLVCRLTGLHLRQVEEKR